MQNDPWKSRTGGLVDMKRLKEKRGIEIVKNMNSNFAKETNQRDEDAEMQKFIEEQLRIKKEQEAKNKESNPSNSSTPANESLISEPIVAKFKRPEDALFDVPRYLIENTSKHKSEETLSEQMLSGIPEVDLGIDERIRNIEETERAKQRIVNQKKPSNQSNPNHSSHNQSQHQQQLARQNSDNSQYAPQNTSVNFVQHKRFDDALINPDHMIKPRTMRPNTANTAHQPVQPVVGDAPKHELLQQANQTNYTTGYSIKSKFNRNNNVPNQNARRQYFVSTNMNEKEPEELMAVTTGINLVEADLADMPAATSASTSASTSANADAVPGDTATSATVSAKKSHKRHHHHHKRNTGQPNEKASDDYCLERFKKNMRFSRNSKIKIC